MLWDLIDFEKAKAAIGEIREWAGIKYKKQADGSWVPLKKKVKHPEKEYIFGGKNYPEFEGHPGEAIDFLLKKQSGQVKNAYERKGLGKIDIIWGDNKFGLKHIYEKHIKELDDFESVEDMCDKIVMLLKAGKPGSFYEQGQKVNLYSGGFQVTIMKTVVYDEEDNFSDKHWVMTSYDRSRSVEEKRKAPKKGLHLKKSLDHTQPGDSALVTPEGSLDISAPADMDADRYNSDYRSIGSFSLSKDINKVHSIQLFCKEFFEKSKEKAQVGEERTWGGKVYVKTVNGWKPKGKLKGAARQDDQPANQHKQNEISPEDRKNVLEEYAANATEAQLESALKKPGQDEEVKRIAEQELKDRGKIANDEADEIATALQKLFDSDEFDDEFKKKLKEKLDERESKKKKDQENNAVEKIRKEFDSFKEEMNQKLETVENATGFKTIKKTGIMVDGKKIFITMDGERYQAKRGGETLKSERGEALSDFKNKVREKWSGKINDDKEDPLEAQKLPTSEKIDKALSKLNDALSAQKNQKLKKSKAYKEVKINANDALIYSAEGKDDQLAANLALIENGEKPLMAPFMFTEYGGEKYTCYDTYFMITREAVQKYRDDFRPSETSLDDATSKAMRFYGYQGDSVIRAVLTGKKIEQWQMENMADLPEDSVEKATQVVKNKIKILSDYLDKNRLKENLILSRRLRFARGKNPFADLKEGDVFTDSSFGSFSLQQLSGFGNSFQITLLAKKGQAIGAVRTPLMTEMEFLSQKNSKFKILGVGTNSIVVEMVD